MDTVVNWLTKPEVLFFGAILLLVLSVKFAEVWTRPPIALGLGPAVTPSPAEADPAQARPHPDRDGARAAVHPVLALAAPGDRERPPSRGGRAAAGGRGEEPQGPRLARPRLHRADLHGDLHGGA